jgi:putative endonuclease
VAGERLAAAHLQARGYEILDRNYRTRHGELDIVAAGGGCLVFCEVKTRVGRDDPGPFGPFASIGLPKRRQVRAMARQWLADRGTRRLGRPRPPGLRFDAIGILLDGAGCLVALEHVEEAF